GDCHYQSGNYKTKRRVLVLKKYLEQMGIETERFHLEWISASEGNKFQKAMTDFTEKIRKLGPLPKVNIND
ncbi:MAG: hydrogenase iron-sulfur subunit, partial [Candidatus Cloacimonetes bacterium]|nr:hydrogenase iron-sulfur subunit [Candidatus Cloacimonadota bacterium]